MLFVLPRLKNSSSSQKQLNFQIQNFFAPQHRKQKAPTKSLYGHNETNQPYYIRKQTGTKFCTQLAPKHKQVSFSKYVFSTKSSCFTSLSEIMDICQPPSSRYSEHFSSESIWNHWCQSKENSPTSPSHSMQRNNRLRDKQKPETAGRARGAPVEGRGTMGRTARAARLRLSAEGLAVGWGSQQHQLETARTAQQSEALHSYSLSLTVLFPCFSLS